MYFMGTLVSSKQKKGAQGNRNLAAAKLIQGSNFLVI